MVKKNESYLNFPTLNIEFEALDCCFISQNQVALLKSNKQVHVMPCTPQAAGTTVNFKVYTYKS